MESIVLKTGGMHCSSCSMLIEMTVDELPGIGSVKADYGSGVTRVDFDPAAISVDRIVAAIVEAGYSAALAA
jgi:copper chaperone CopZ